MNKKIILVGACSFLIMFSMSLFIYAKDAQIDGHQLNVRSGPGTAYETITQVNTPENYPIIEEQAEWVKIQLPHQEGWVHRDYITVNVEDIEKEPLETTQGNIEETVQEDRLDTRKVNEADPLYTADLSGKVIVIDPGHGGRDVGAIGSSDSYESNHTLRTAHLLQAELERYGANVFLTRENDRYLSLTTRSSYANLKHADVFLSLHYNSIPEHPQVKGIDTYYYSERDKRLAEYVHAGILEFTNMEDRGVKQEDLQVLRTNHRPALLLELGFISNEAEEKRIQTKPFLEAMSRGISKGLLHYFQ